MEVRGTDFVVYQISDLDRSIAFYRDTLGLELEAVIEEVGWAEFSVQPTTLALSDPAKHQPGAKPRPGGASIFLAVDDVGAALDELRAKDVPVILEAFESPVCWLAVVADPDGNPVGLHKRKDGTCG